MPIHRRDKQYDVHVKIGMKKLEEAVSAWDGTFVERIGYCFYPVLEEHSGQQWKAQYEVDGVTIRQHGYTYSGGIPLGVICTDVEAPGKKSADKVIRKIQEVYMPFKDDTGHSKEGKKIAKKWLVFNIFYKDMYKLHKEVFKQKIYSVSKVKKVLSKYFKILDVTYIDGHRVLVVCVKKWLFFDSCYYN